METEELLEKISKDFEIEPKINEEFSSKQMRFSEILKSYELVPKNKTSKAQILDEVKRLDAKLTSCENNEYENKEMSDKNNDNKENVFLNKENTNSSNNIQPKKHNKNKDDIEFELMTELVKYFENFITLQEGFCKKKCYIEAKFILRSRNSERAEFIN